MARQVLITGGMSGIGLATAQAFARAGDCVSVVDATESTAGKDVVAKSGGKVFAGDVGDFARAESVVEDLVAAGGRLDVLVNNAGISRDRVLWRMSEAEWDAVLAVDLKGAFNYLRAAASVFRRQRGGKVVNVSSVNGLRGKSGLANYGAAKAGLIALTRTAARELGPANVNVNAVAPGWVETPLTASYSAEVREQALRESALGRLGKPDEIASVILFLCSEQARHITGQVVVADGGQTA